MYVVRDTENRAKNRSSMLINVRYDQKGLGGFLILVKGVSH